MTYRLNDHYMPAHRAWPSYGPSFDQWYEEMGEAEARGGRLFWLGIALGTALGIVALAVVQAVWG